MLEATSIEEAREMLRKKHMTVEDLRIIPEGVPSDAFSAAMPWTNTDDDSAPAPQKTVKKKMTATLYVPLLETLRLFAGWLLTFCSAIYMLGALQLRGHLPWEIPLLQALLSSPLILHFACVTFLFLLCTNLHRWLGRGIGLGILLTVIGLSTFVLFHINT